MFECDECKAEDATATAFEEDHVSDFEDDCYGRKCPPPSRALGLANCSVSPQNICESCRQTLYELGEKPVCRTHRIRHSWCATCRGIIDSNIGPIDRDMQASVRRAGVPGTIESSAVAVAKGPTTPMTMTTTATMTIAAMTSEADCKSTTSLSVALSGDDVSYTAFLLGSIFVPPASFFAVWWRRPKKASFRAPLFFSN